MRVCVTLLLLCLASYGQNAPGEYKVYTEHPRLLLKTQRLRLLKRERERRSPRWLQFEALVRGNAQMPEPAFALALFYKVTEESQWARQAIAGAMRPNASIRDVALALDWCDPEISDSERASLTARLQSHLGTPPGRDFSSIRDRAFAAIAVEDAGALRNIIESWWRESAAPDLRSGARALSQKDFYPFVELLHVVRDNLQIDLRDDILAVFRDLAVERVLGYYPAAWPAPENDYRIPWFTGKRDPDLRIAALGRAGEMSLIAYESNAQEMQFLQGWVMHDRFVLRSPFGAPYEFLWANPYQPGLPFEKLPLRFHNPRTGTLLLRSTWDDDATWVAWYGGGGQMFADGRIGVVNLLKPMVVGDSVLLTGDQKLTRFQVPKDSPVHWFVIGLKPGTNYDIEVDDEGMRDSGTDRAGILPLLFERQAGQSVFVHEPRRAGAPVAASRP